MRRQFRVPAFFMSRWTLVGLVALIGAGWRLWLIGRYAGWEESDYGNLAMVRGVLDGGFLHYDMNHMPGYYAIAAAVLAVVGDAVIAARAVSWVGGVVALGLAVYWTDRNLGRRVAMATGLLLVFQPEFALYASSSLREPVYAAFVVGSLVALSRERLWTASILAGLAFSVRFDAAVVLGLVLLVHALGRSPRRMRVVSAMGPLVGAVLLWSIYCRIEHGTFLFWSHSVAVNVETGLGAEATSPLTWLLAGLEVVVGLMGWLLPWRIGWGVWLGGLVALLSVPWRRHDPRRTWGVAALALVGWWAAIGLVGQHAPEHNLYWKWLCPVVPVAVPLALSGVFVLTDRLAKSFGSLATTSVVLLVLAQAVFSNLRETQRQVERADALYRPQLELGRWIETEVPESLPLLLDNIPACWLDRRPHDRTIISWFDVPVGPDDPDAFQRWITSARIGWVLWFREDWTQAPRIAPFLERGGAWRRGAVELVERDREDEYGWILYEVLLSEGLTKPPSTP